MSIHKPNISQPEEDACNAYCDVSNQQALNDPEASLRDIKNQQSEQENLFMNNVKKKEGWTITLFLCGIVTNVGACIPVGYSFGVLNTPQAIIREFCNSTIDYRYGVQMNISEMNILWSAIVSAPLISGMTGSLTCGYFADRYGRKWTLFHCLVMETVSGLLLISSRWALSVEMLLIARLLLGFAGGLVTGVSPMYLTEVAPFHLRGTMGVLCPLGLSTGVFVAQIFGFSFILGHESTWHYLLGLYIILTIPSLVVLLFLPESPKYLYVIRGHQEKGIKELIRLRNTNQSELKEDLDELYLERMRQDKNERKSFGVLELLKSCHLRLPLLLVVSMQAGQQLSGINGDYSWWMPYLSILAVLAFVFCYGFGLGPIPFFIGAELFEIGPRPTAMALGSMANWGGNFAVGMAFPLLQQWFGTWAFAPFVVSSLSLATFLKDRLPETKGLDPIKVSLMFSQPTCPRCRQLIPSNKEADGEAILPMADASTNE